MGFLIDRWQPARGGAESALARLAEHLAWRACDVHVFARTSDASDTDHASARSGATHHDVRAGFGTRVRRERQLARRLVAAARETACEVTIGVRHLEQVDIYWPHHGTHAGELAARARRLGRAPVGEGTAHGKHGLFLELERRLLEGAGARRVVCVSELVAEEIRRFYPAASQRLVVVPNGVDLERFHPRLRASAGAELRAATGLAPDEPLISFVARHPRAKGLGELLRALRLLRARRWRLIVAGVKRPGIWRLFVARHGFRPSRVRIQPWCSTPELLAASDLTVVPTWRDTSLGVALESLATGTPVVTSRFAGDAELVAAPSVGSVVSDPGDIRALAGAIEGWLDRIEAGVIDRAALRARVAARGLDPWLARLEEVVRRSASE